MDELVLCHRCKGEGVIHCEECTCYHRGDYDRWNETCDTCKGSGRLIRIETVKYSPYKNPTVKKEAT